jgi:ferredoxin
MPLRNVAHSGKGRRVEIQIDPCECTGCGSCVDVCPSEAIRLVDGKALIYQEVCNGCGDCVAVCPSQAISRSEPERVAMLVPADQQQMRTSVELASSSALQNVVPWAGAALMLLGKQVARNLADALLAALEERTSQPLDRAGKSPSPRGAPVPVRGKRGRRQRRRRRGKGR